MTKAVKKIKTSKVRNIKLVVIMLGITMLMIGCSNVKKPNAETLVIQVDDSKVYMDEMMYHVMLAEMQGQLYASFVGDEESYWDMKNEDGTTMGEAMKDLALQNAIKYELLYKIAIQEGYTLTEEEKEISQSKVDNIVQNVQGEQLDTTELTNEKLIKIQDKIAIATKYYDNYVGKLEVDEEAIKARYKLEDYKQYDIQYIFADKDGYDELASFVEAANTTEDITTLTKDGKATSGRLSFIEGEDTFGEETNLEDAIKPMMVGEVSDVIETIKGYYIIKLIDNTSTKKYESAVKEAVENAITEAFQIEYDALKKKHEIVIRNKVWDKIEIGKTIIDTPL